MVIFGKTAILAILGIFGISRKIGIFVKMVIFADLAKKVKNGDFWKNEENDENDRSAKMTEI
jgi:hypothetical protein